MPRRATLLSVFLTLLAAGAVRADTGRLTYPAQDNLDLKAGTLECWVKLGFDPEEMISAREYRGLATLFALKAEKGGLNVLMFSGAMFKDTYGWSCSIGGEGKPLPFAARCRPWKQDEWHHIALVWDGQKMMLYLDGKKASERVQPVTLETSFGRMTEEPIRFGDKWGKRAKYVIDDLRLSAVARKPEELGFHGRLKPDPFTRILDGFEADFAPDGKTRTKPEVMFSGEGGLPDKMCEFVEGKFGKGLAFYRVETGKGDAK